MNHRPPDQKSNALTTRPLHLSLFNLSVFINISPGKKGGALLSALHSNMQHGDPFVKSLVRHTLNLVRTVSGDGENSKFI